jgi:hypothetical protein
VRRICRRVLRGCPDLLLASSAASVLQVGAGGVLPGSETKSGEGFALVGLCLGRTTVRRSSTPPQPRTHHRPPGDNFSGRHRRGARTKRSPSISGRTLSG